MRTPNSGTVFYVPGTPPQDAADVPRFLTLELTKIAGAVQSLAAGHLDPSTVAPAKPRQGDFRYADGANWNPGSGAGWYWYSGAQWLPFAANGKAVINNNASATYTVASGVNYVGFTGTQVASLAFTFPAASAAIDGLQVRIYTQAAVGTSATWASSGATFVGAPATLASGSVTRFIYHHATLQWLPA